MTVRDLDEWGEENDAMVNEFEVAAPQPTYAPCLNMPPFDNTPTQPLIPPIMKGSPTPTPTNEAPLNTVVATADVKAAIL